MADSYKFHPAANIFPLMNDDEFERLKDDIAERGQQDDILLLCEKIIDGRNRYRAALALGRTPQIAELDAGTDPIAFVLSANLHRRQLKQSQRAMCAAKMAGLPRGTNQHRKEEGQICPSKSAEEAAAIFNVSERSVKTALAVLRDGCKQLIEMCEGGAVSLNLASNFISEVPNKKDQVKITKNGAKAVREAVPRIEKEQSVNGKIDILAMLNSACECYENEMVVGYVDRWLESQDERPLVDRIMALVELATDDEKERLRKAIK